MAATPNGFAASQAKVGASASLICAARADRRAVTVENHGSTDVYIGGSGVTTSNGILLPGGAGSNITIPTTAAIYGIVASGTQTVGVAETFS